MPLNTTTVDFEAERERLQERMDDVADRQLDATGAAAKRLLELGQDLNAQINILDAIAAGDVDTVEAFDGLTLTGLTTGDINLIEDVIEDDDRLRARDAWVALASEDAPYVAHDRDEFSRSGFEDTIQNVVDLPLPYVEWAEARVSELSHLDEEAGNGYLELVRDKQQARKSDGNG